MSHDPYWSMPLVNWGPTSSFNYPYPPPPDPPDAGELITLPCINRFWLQLLAGAAMQLRNPATWQTHGDEAALSTVLTQADQLIFMLGEGIGCVNPITGMALVGCNLVATFADASTETVMVFGHDNCACDVSCAFPPIPPNPGPSAPEQHACNIAGYLATEVIEKTMKAVSDNLTNCGSHLPSCQTIAQWATQLTALFAPYLPATAAATIAFNDIYQEASAQILSEVQFAATDPLLWSEVTCAIFNAIRATTYVSPSNFNAIVTNLAAISYTYAWVPNDLSIFVGNMGYANFQALQTVGALDDVDCSNCGGNWCSYFDFSAGQQGWQLDPALPLGSYVPGVGWQSQVTSPDGDLEVIISIDPPQPAQITSIDVYFVKDHADSGVHPSDASTQDPIGTVTASATFPGIGAWPTPAWTSKALVGTANRVAVDFISLGAGDPSHLQIRAVQLHGTGVCPFSVVGNCIH